MAVKIGSDGLADGAVKPNHLDATVSLGGGSSIGVNVKSYGAKGDGTTDDTAAIQAAINDATKNGTVSNTVYFPAGTYKYTAQIVAIGAIIIGAGMLATTLICPNQLGIDVVSFIIRDIDGLTQSSGMANISFQGPGPRSLGLKTANTDGIQIDGQTRLTQVKVVNFDKGLINNAPYGHVSLVGVVASDNYYGLYCKNDNGDLLISDSAINGNTFANIAIPSSPWGISAFLILRTHLGFAPYGIYQEPGGTGNFLVNGIIMLAAFESCGNGAIFTETAAPNSNNGGFFSIKIIHPGFSWNDAYRIPGRNKDYAVTLGLTGGRCEYWGGGYPFQNGTIGSWDFKNNYAVWDFQMDPNEIVAIESGRKDFLEVRVAGDTQIKSAQIPAGATQVEVSTGMKVPAESMHMMVTPRSSGGLTAPFTLIATNPYNAGDGTAHFSVQLVAGAATTQPLSFNYSVT